MLFWQKVLRYLIAFESWLIVYFALINVIKWEYKGLIQHKNENHEFHCVLTGNGAKVGDSILFLNKCSF